MIKFTLPASTVVGRAIPKNSFDAYMSSAQKRLLGGQIERLRWTHKLSTDTINLPGLSLKEIQFFEVTLRDPNKISALLDVIDRAIPYPIVFTLQFGDQISWRVAVKHPNPVNQDNAVIDWIFAGAWHDGSEAFPIVLEKNLDEVFLQICKHISRFPKNQTNLPDLVDYARKRNELELKIIRFKQDMTKPIQFNRKVKLNIALLEAQEALRQLDL